MMYRHHTDQEKEVRKTHADIAVHVSILPHYGVRLDVPHLEMMHRTRKDWECPCHHLLSAYDGMSAEVAGHPY